MLTAGIDHLLRPDAGLYLTDVRTIQQKHAETRLTDTTTDGVRKLTLEQHLMVWKICTLLTAGLLQLRTQRSLVDTNTHGADLQCTVERRIPEQDVAVQCPVIIVRCTTIVRLPV